MHLVQLHHYFLLIRLSLYSFPQATILLRWSGSSIADQLWVVRLDAECVVQGLQLFFVVWHDFQLHTLIMECEIARGNYTAAASDTCTILKVFWLSFLASDKWALFFIEGYILKFLVQLYIATKKRPTIFAILQGQRYEQLNILFCVIGFINRLQPYFPLRLVILFLYMR